MMAEETKSARIAYGGKVIRHVVHIHRVRLMPLQAEEHSLVTAVAFAGGAKRPEELDSYPSSRGQQPFTCQTSCKEARSPHWPHGVRARRSDANFEKIERTDSHIMQIPVFRGF